MGQPIELHRISMNGKDWFVDLILEELRNVKDPHDRIPFNQVKSPIMRRKLYNLIEEKGGL